MDNWIWNTSIIGHASIFTALDRDNHLYCNHAMSAVHVDLPPCFRQQVTRKDYMGEGSHVCFRRLPYGLWVGAVDEKGSKR